MLYASCFLLNLALELTLAVQVMKNSIQLSYMNGKYRRRIVFIWIMYIGKQLSNSFYII